MVISWPLALLISALNPHSLPAKPQTSVAFADVTACAAVTRSDVEGTLRRTVAAGAEEKDTGGSTCDYSTSAGTVTVVVRHLSRKLNLAEEINSMKAAFPNAELRDVAGVGTKAVLLDLGSSGAQVHVVRGDFDYLLVSVLGFGDASRVSGAAIQLARKAASRLF